MATGKGPLRTALEDFLETFGFDKMVSEILTFVRERDESEWAVMLSGMIDLIISSTKDSPELQNLFYGLKNKKHQLGATLMSGIGTSAAGGASSAMLAPVFRLMNASMETKAHSNLPDVSMLLDLHNRKFISPAGADDILNYLGYKPEFWPILKEAAIPRLGPGELIQLSRRLPQAKEYYYQRILKLGWEAEELNKLNAVSLQYPSPQDFIRFAVREAMDEKSAADLELDSETPQAAIVESEKSGLAPDYFKYYWRSHWELPSAEMGFEFLHRFYDPNDPLHFSDSDMDGLLKYLDYSPKWRSRIKAISYNLLTRVDLRRIRKAGIVDDDFMYHEARASGYDDFRAKAIVKWWNWENNQDVIDLTKSQIEKGYKSGVLKMRAANEALKTAEPNEATRQFLFALWDNDIQQKNTQAEVDLIEQEYAAGQYDEPTLIGKLDKLGLAKTQEATLLLQMEVSRRKAIKHLSRSELEILYEHNQIDAKTAASKLEAVGYPADEVKDLMFIIDHNAQKDRASELLAAQKEQERLATSKLTNQYQKDTAAKNVHIAELNAQIADLKVTASQTDDPDVTGQISDMILEIKNEIAIANVDKAKLSLQASIDRGNIGA
jgi:hypothetical protein